MKFKSVKEHWVIGLVLLFGFVHGLIYVFLVPPWQHYDEPGNFEFAWLIADQSRLPKPGEYDQQMRRELAASMLEHEFFKGMDFRPNLLLENDEIWIGISQINDQPVFYALLGTFLHFISTSDIVFQLYLGRLVSLTLFLICVFSAWRITIELTPVGHPLRWMLPASMVMLPGFLDTMTAINDDVGATVLFSLFLWLGIRLIKKGFQWIRLLVFFGLAGLCFWTKDTVTIAILLIGLPVLFSILRGSKRRLAWATFAIGSVVLGSAIIGWGDAAFWYRYSSPDLSTRSINPQAPLGEDVFRIYLSPNNNLPRLIQIVPNSMKEQLKDRSVSLGAWIWASKPVKVRTPILETDDQVVFREVEVGVEPTFFSVTTALEPDTSKLNVILSPVKSSVNEAYSVYYDGVVLAEGNRPLNMIPVFDDADGMRGEWGDTPFTNLIRNASAEKSWPWIRRWADRLIDRHFPGRPSLILAFLLDRSPASGYYQSTFKMLSHTFWARFGWGHVTLIGYHPYLIIGLITLSGLVGANFALWRLRRRLQWEIVLFLGIPLIVIWGSTIMRGGSTIVDYQYIVPVSRYAYAAIVPTMLVLNMGWLEIIHWFERWLSIPKRVMFALFLLFFFSLDMLSLLTIIKFYGT